jgi:outer membrane protein OmpA-like peptidoglycan-associated protein
MRTFNLIAAACLTGAVFSGPVQAYWGSPWGGPWGWPGGTYTGFGPLDGFMDGDMDFNMSLSGHGRGYGRGRGYGYGYGYPGYGYPGYGYPGYAYGHPPYGYPHYPLAYVPAPAQAPAPAPTPARVEAAPVDPDSDNDGVADSTDLCPDTAAGVSVDFTGCTDARPIALQGVNFKLDSDELTPESSVILDRVVRTLTANPQVRVEIGGHTDAQGDAAYNLDLSARRAVTVRDYLVSHGVNADNLTSRGYGQTRLLDSADTPQAHARNRRVELGRLDSATRAATQ